MVAVVVALLLLEVEDVGEVEEEGKTEVAEEEEMEVVEEEETEVVEEEKLVVLVEAVMMERTMRHAQCVRFPFQVFSLKMDEGMGMTREAKRARWDVSLKFGKRTTWLNQRRVLWFSTGMFRKYKSLNSARL